MRILFAAAEVTPFAKVGGLADVAGSLPPAIKELGHDVRVILPAYGSVNFDAYKVEDVPNSEVTLRFNGRNIPVSLKQSTLPDSNVIVYFVVNNDYFGSHSEIYPRRVHARFEQERFIIFCRAILEIMKKINFKPDIIHCNDWHAAMIPAYLKSLYKDLKFYTDIKTVFSIHNLAYQGWFDPKIINFAEMDFNKMFNVNGLECYGQVNWMKGGIIYSDQVNTVSEKYAQEIQTPEYGEGLDGLLKANKNKLIGILNGIDYKEWDPETDKNIIANYSPIDLSGKKACKKRLQEELKFHQKEDIPLIGVVSRLVDQKGIDLIAAIGHNLKNMDLQFVILGSGDPSCEMLLKDVERVSANVKVFIGFDQLLSRRIYAGSDMFLMPSKFEPCGLGQLIALKYGSIPIVRNTGGLADTITDYSKNKKAGNGFVFEKYDSTQLLHAIEAALKAYNNKRIWNSIIKRAMKCDFSWKSSAQKYVELYEKARK